MLLKFRMISFGLERQNWSRLLVSQAAAVVHLYRTLLFKIVEQTNLTYLANGRSALESKR